MTLHMCANQSMQSMAVMVVLGEMALVMFEGHHGQKAIKKNFMFFGILFC